MGRLVDVSLALSGALVTWPGDPKPVLSRLTDLDHGDACTTTHLSMVVHTGTHVDAPAHFVQGGAGVDQLALDTLIGPALVVRIPDGADAITPAHLAHIPAGTRRILFKTRNSARWADPTHDFDPDFVALTPDAAQALVDMGVGLVGIDYLSVERFNEPGNATHLALLGAGVVALEGLDLRRVEAGPWRLICLPLNIPGCDGAPARVVLESLSGDTDHSGSPD
jgi:arylformamidase